MSHGVFTSDSGDFRVNGYVTNRNGLGLLSMLLGTADRVNALDALVDELGYPEQNGSHRRRQPRTLVVIALDEASAARALSDTDLEMAAAIVRTRFDEASDHLEALWIDRAQRSLVLLVGTSKVSGLGERLCEMSTDLSQHWWVSDDGRNTHLEVGTGWFLLDDRQTRAEYAQIIRETADAAQISLSRRDLNSIPGHALGSGPRARTRSP